MRMRESEGKGRKEKRFVREMSGIEELGDVICVHLSVQGRPLA